MKQFSAIFLFLILLLLRFFLFYQNQPQYQDGQQLEFEITLLSEPQTVGSLQRVIANLENGERIFITTAQFPEFHYGQTLRFSGDLKKRLLTNEKVILTMFFPNVKPVETPLKSGLALTSFIRQKVILLFEKTLPPNSSGLLLGVVFGIREGMDKTFSNDLRLSGVLHVVAASGMNVTMVGGFLSSLFGSILRRQIALVFSIFGILFYALLAGFEPSIMRASIMGIFAFSAQILGRQNLATYALFLAGYLMLLFSPSLIFDVGFQLSFLATLGLLHIKPLLFKKLVIGDDLTTTISAQAVTLPILLSNFGSYSLWSVIVNGLVLWTIPILMILGGVGAMFGLLIEPLGQLILYLALPFLLFFEMIVHASSKWGGVVALESFPWQIAVGYYGLLLATIVFFGKKKK
ncbi:MAG: ComEC/Rec2 family competence protein [Candidatus Levybacteria bacterium]|nr:ComEC/Rec2 family competence protein [Candidatus Levybacteria bacterium]